MEIVLIVVVVIIAVAVLALAPMNRRHGDVAEDEMRARGVDVDRQFHRPRDEGDLL